MISGAFTGDLTVVINKKDFDLGVTVHEAMRGGKLLHLGTPSIARATVRTPRAAPARPGKAEHVKFETTLELRRCSLARGC